MEVRVAKHVLLMVNYSSAIILLQCSFFSKMMHHVGKSYFNAFEGYLVAKEIE